MRHMIPAVLIGVAVCVPCTAGLFGSRCPACGCQQIEQVCRVVPDIKKETVTRFVVEKEDICLPGKSQKADCADGACAAHAGSSQIPTCGRIIHKKKLKKITETVEKPGWKCVVETVCRDCGQHCGR